MSRFTRTILLTLLLLTLVGCTAAPTATPVVEVQVVTATPEPVTPTVPQPTQTPVVEYVVVTPTPDAAATAAAEAAHVTLIVTGPDGEQTLTQADLESLPTMEGWGGIKSSTGKITPPDRFKGVSLLDLCELVADCDESVAINVVARDGYAMTLSYDQLAEGEFTTFNPGTGEEVEREGDLDVIVAYERAGEPIPEDEDGPLRLAIINDENNQVTDGHWSVKWVEQVVIKPAVAEWTLYLEGAITEVMDRNTFESGAAPNCHLGEWTDDEGHVWAGIPFYYMLGRVDDDNAHEGGAYNDELAQAGYTVDVIAADGYTVSLDSTRLHRNRDVILAYLMDGEPLPEKHFPLRLVGDDLAGNERVSAVAQIVLDIPPAGEQEAGSEPAATTEPQETEAEETAPAAPERAAPEMALGTLHIYGAVGEPIAFDRAHLEQIGIETYTVEHPKKGAIEVQGVLLNEVLAETAPVAEATSIVFTASDGYSAESDLAPVLACDTCLIEVEGDTYNLVMPDLQTNYWVKDVRLIELKR